MQFGDFVGNAALKSALSGAFSRRRLPHAILLAGEAGLGKRTLARQVARAVVWRCADREAAPCGVCPASIRSAAGSHPDIRAISFQFFFYPREDVIPHHVAIKDPDGNFRFSRQFFQPVGPTRYYPQFIQAFIQPGNLPGKFSADSRGCPGYDCNSHHAISLLLLSSMHITDRLLLGICLRIRSLLLF